LTHNENWTGVQNPPALKNGDTVGAGTNWSQPYPPREVAQGITGLTIEKDVNLCNCILPLDAVNQGREPIKLDMCSHEYSHFLVFGLADCGNDNEPCSHVDEVDTVTVDGVEYIIGYERSSKVVA